MKKKAVLLLTLALSAASILPVSASDGEQKTLTMWTIATEGDANHEAFGKAIEEYEAEHPDIHIEMEAFENESYKTKIKASVAANELPDIYFTWGGGFSSAFVEAGKAMELDSYYETYKDELPESTLKYATYDDKLYGVPYVVSISGIFYNKPMFEEYNLEEPKTWDELINVCQTFLDNGITPFGVSVKEAWVMAMFNDALTLKCVGDEKINAAFTRSGQSYLDEEFLDAAKKLEQLITMGAFSESAAGISNDEAVALFTNGTVPMFVTGAFLEGSLLQAENPDDFGFMLFPVCSDNAVLTDSMGGSADMLMVNPGTENPDEAANAAFEIAKLVSKYGYMSGAGIAAWKVDYEVENQSSISKTMSDCINESTSLTVWSGSLMEAEDYTEYQALLQQFFVGDLTAEDFVEAMDAQLNQ
ncbi:ABC transporter, solute-binding protein [Marvinbryantia formatexigens DSM 14469]|uniref:ABC transporter, solute-binding protein n=1 Tax=Marvinbryantia formatexigens DSM 14469 TaxID=478749 RepID=C6LHI3_9FIRM|nr:extracellular solute-binding protein [Marvinbryantia formatexigens]EET59970.1 ABC transporter, solute-binding protein [Marvinbryantia formatexigens DSM 14469]UWO25873.1 extracellular solute-binding protein [Marvinbryantia formatexigens DSM 14469]SDF40988.1 raffinose/stachyose/melibiose transport system substrate-binding protein [Marvinbryantia formatexigens]